MTVPHERTDGPGPRTVRLMVVPEPRDKAFVERVRREIDEARRRVKEMSGSDDGTPDDRASSSPSCLDP